MLRCPENKQLLFKMCINYEDYILIYFNLLVVVGVCTAMLIRNLIYYNTKQKTSLQVNNNFSLLVDGPLGEFYTICNNQPKQANNKKKVQGKSVEKEKNQVCNSELKCNVCSRSIELSYQNTINKLLTNN